MEKKVYSIVTDALENANGAEVTVETLRAILIENDKNPTYLPIYLNRAKEDGFEIIGIENPEDKRKMRGYILKTASENVVKKSPGRPLHKYDLRKFTIRGEKGRFMNREQKIAALSTAQSNNAIAALTGAVA